MIWLRDPAIPRSSLRPNALAGDRRAIEKAPCYPSVARPAPPTGWSAPVPNVDLAWSENHFSASFRLQLVDVEHFAVIRHDQMAEDVLVGVLPHSEDRPIAHRDVAEP